MEFLFGVLTTVLFFCCVSVAYRMGKKQAKKISKVNTPSEEEQHQKEQIKRYNDHFKKLFSYDVDKALQRKKVM
jgi:cystathionine beta-lyase/cystathionine gamma-synthase